MKTTARVAKRTGPLPRLTDGQQSEYEGWLGRRGWRDSDANLAAWLELSHLPSSAFARGSN